ncbi:pullulanase X25 domain-containing protein [Arthrobacter sp. U41]|uniref:pullulanase X25 domain-containing protein n=1 Tax=Arthrobacter sp. U41 TaxID=1849032 RepID=UPI0008595D1F|nr:glycosidase [Arthrobacter sp. U41]AOT03609.1 glycosidase [Arthrobacter sp. U41]
MGANTAENTTRRLKAVLDVLAEGVWTGEKLNAGAVLGEAIARVPLNEFERELLSGGIPRGHKTLTTATAKLVKAGWLVKGRAGWTITEDGQRATVAFADPAAFAAALDAGTPVPADTPLPSAPPAGTPVRKAASEAAAPKAATVAEKVAGKAAKLVEDAVAPVAKAVRKRKAADKAAESPATAPAAEKPAAATTAATAPAAASPVAGAAAAAAAAPATSVGTVEQPEAVAVAGDFNILLGAPANWAPQYDESQMELDLVDQLWKLAADLPAGTYSFKIALNRSWDENFGAFGAFDGTNHEVRHSGGLLVIHYDHRTRDIIIILP